MQKTRRVTDTILHNAKFELRRLTSAYSESPGLDSLVPDINNIRSKTYTGINWEEIVRSQNPSKIKPPITRQESTVSKERPKLVL